MCWSCVGAGGTCLRLTGEPCKSHPLANFWLVLGVIVAVKIDKVDLLKLLHTCKAFPWMKRSNYLVMVCVCVCVLHWCSVSSQYMGKNFCKIILMQGRTCKEYGNRTWGMRKAKKTTLHLLQKMCHAIDVVYVVFLVFSFLPCSVVR